MVLFNPVEQERLCALTVLVNTVRVRVLTEDGQTVPVQLSAQWSSAAQMSAEVFEVGKGVTVPLSTPYLQTLHSSVSNGLHKHYNSVCWESCSNLKC